MIKAVIDTNVFVAGLINEAGAPAKIINFWEERAFDLLISEMILKEYKDMLLSLPKIPENKSWEILEIIGQLAIKIDVRENFSICKDMLDNKFMDWAVNGKADYLVTKNLKHFPKDFRGVKVITVGYFLDVIEKYHYEVWLLKPVIDDPFISVRNRMKRGSDRYWNFECQCFYSLCNYGIVAGEGAAAFQGSSGLIKSDPA